MPLPVTTRHAWTPDEPSELAAHADRRNARGKLAAGWRGLKSAIRGDSSFFAHGYRGTLIVITAALLGVDQRGWCLLVIGRLPGPDRRAGPQRRRHPGPRHRRPRGAAAEDRPRDRRRRRAGRAAFGSGAVTLIVLSWKFIELLTGNL